MSNIYCTECGVSGFSKCPYCRSIFLDHDQPIAFVEEILSHRLKIHKDKLEWRLYQEQTALDGLRNLRDLLKDVSDEDLKVLACVHSWDFKPCMRSTIGCGHGSEEKPLEQFMQDAAMYVAERGEEDAYKILEDAIREIGSVAD